MTALKAARFAANTPDEGSTGQLGGKGSDGARATLAPRGATAPVTLTAWIDGEDRFDDALVTTRPSDAVFAISRSTAAAREAYTTERGLKRLKPPAVIPIGTAPDRVPPDACGRIPPAGSYALVVRRAFVPTRWGVTADALVPTLAECVRMQAATAAAPSDHLRTHAQHFGHQAAAARGA